MRDSRDREAAERLNLHCFCMTLDRAALERSLRAQLDGADCALGPEHRNLFSDTPVFAPRADVEAMQQIVLAIDAAARSPGYRETVLSWAPAIARFAPGPIGAFMGYDFHLGEQGPRLIEVNTNAGGAFVNAQLARAQRICCEEAARALRTAEELDRFEAAVVRMFESEWRRQRGAGRPACVAIVDDRPEAQHMYPEFLLAQRLLQAHGIETLILDPGELDLAHGELLARGRRIDLVYNRLVDFALAAPGHAALREAYLAGAAVVTPNPHVHALLADKRNLTVLSDGAKLREFGLSEGEVQLLEAAVPRAVPVTAENADALWQARRELFFKPAAGHGSKGVYRGSKLTRGVFAEIVRGGYVAQRYVPPSERLIEVDGAPLALKVDVRLYTYEGRTLLTAARIYRGQATNLRTPGGGFAPLFQL